MAHPFPSGAPEGGLQVGGAHPPAETRAIHLLVQELPRHRRRSMEDCFFLGAPETCGELEKTKAMSPRIFIVNHCDLFDKGRYAQNQKAMAAMERWSTEIWETPTQRNCLWRVWIWPSRMVATNGCKGLATTKTTTVATHLPRHVTSNSGGSVPRDAQETGSVTKNLVDVPFVHIKWLFHGYNFSVFKQPLDVDTVRYDLNMPGCNETYHSGNMGFWPIFHMYRSRIHLFKKHLNLAAQGPQDKMSFL